MKKWIQNILGITEIINEKKRQTDLLSRIYKECQRNSDLVDDYNKAYNIKKNVR